VAIDQLIGAVLRSELFIIAALAIASVILTAYQIFAAVVFARFVFFFWRWLGVNEMALEEQALKLKGEWKEEHRATFAGFEASRNSRWRSVLLAVYLFILGTAVVAGFFAFNQPSAWVLLIVLGVLFLILCGLIVING
jgi:hypothetical protein